EDGSPKNQCSDCGDFSCNGSDVGS
ncbi:hypothetical protein A2U01_0090835, partial [Trifolium medium]|nr:hypothetical protein [Trifolium medium]